MSQITGLVRIVLIFFLAVWLQLPLSSPKSVVEAYKDGLYSTEDDVIPLNNITLMSRVVHSKEKTVWIVEFYNSWCGHCIQFAPTWKKLATALKGWNDLVRIAAIDCSQSINLDSCRKFDIDGYPTMKMFSPRGEYNGKRGLITRELRSREMDTMTRKIIDFMTEFALPSWPRLQPLASIQDIWLEKKDHHKYMAVIFEEGTSLVGRKVLLDMRNTPNVLVGTMLNDSAAKLGLTQFPSLYEIREDSTFRLLGIGNKMASQDHQLFVKMLQVLSKGEGDKLNFSLAKKKDSPAGSKQDAASKNQQKSDPVLSPSSLSLSLSQNDSLRVSMQDLESALHYGFRQEIAICKTIDGEKFSALQKFVHVLLKYFPGRAPIMRFLRAVNDMLSSVTDTRLSGEEWIANIDDIQSPESFLPDVIQWDCCKGSMPRYRGYPCAMWTLFHVLTVSSYVQQSHSGRGTNPLEVPLAIRGYMDHFFGCAECSKHFLSMAASMEQEISDAKGAVLWLWSAHNKVNRRLKGDQSEDKMFPKVQFPAGSLCKTCHSAQETNASEPVWNMEIVFKFLVSFYVEKNIYVSNELLEQESHQSLNDVAKVNEKGEDDALPSNSAAAASRVQPIQQGELDWWEGKQREQDLKKVRQLRERKKEKGLKNVKFGAGAVERLRALNPPLKEKEFAVYEMKGDQGSKGGGLLSDLDLSMCVVFYLISTLIILSLYHHFIVRKKTSPCPTNCLR